MVPEQYVGKSYLLVGEALRFRRDGVRIRFERGSEPTFVRFEPGDTRVDVGLLLRQRQIVEAPEPPASIARGRAVDVQPPSEEG